ncbi:MAG: hypothetical protein U9Q81_21715 [Pseudomonadota bacterium]|nr:hypothetical protein [Pseudomonadota bacterium]
MLNPVRAGTVDAPEQWSWSSYRALVGEAPVPDWLAVDGLLREFGTNRKEVRIRHRRFVLEGAGQDGLWDGLRQQTYLGNEKFVQRMQARAQVSGDLLTVPRAQRRHGGGICHRSL